MSLFNDLLSQIPALGHIVISKPVCRLAIRYLVIPTEATAANLRDFSWSKGCEAAIFWLRERLWTMTLFDLKSSPKPHHDPFKSAFHPPAKHSLDFNDKRSKLPEHSFQDITRTAIFPAIIVSEAERALQLTFLHRLCHSGRQPWGHLLEWQ